jgi:hypothetical protein
MVISESTFISFIKFHKHHFHSFSPSFPVDFLIISELYCKVHGPLPHESSRPAERSGYVWGGDVHPAVAGLMEVENP